MRKGEDSVQSSFLSEKRLKRLKEVVEEEQQERRIKETERSDFILASAPQQRTGWNLFIGASVLSLNSFQASK